MSNKDDAEVMRKVASHMEEMASLLGQLDKEVWGDIPEETLATGQWLREEAGKLDPAVEWEWGDYALDGEGDLWYFDGDYWVSAITSDVLYYKDDLHLLEQNYGKLRRAYVADPAEQEVVVSIDGIDQRVLDAYHEVEDDQAMSTAGRLTRRAAKAAREQLGEVQ